MAAGTLFVLDASLPGGFVEGSGDLRYAQTMAFTTLMLFQLFNVFNARSDERQRVRRACSRTAGCGRRSACRSRCRCSWSTRRFSSGAFGTDRPERRRLAVCAWRSPARCCGSGSRARPWRGPGADTESASVCPCRRLCTKGRWEGIRMLEAVMAEEAREPGPAVQMEGAGPDPAALWAAFAPPLRGFLARRVPPGVDADDLVQEVFLRVIRHAGSLRSTDRPEAWLFQIARNALRDALRARLRRDGRNDAVESDDDLVAEPDPLRSGPPKRSWRRASHRWSIACRSRIGRRSPSRQSTASARPMPRGSSGFPIRA